MSDLKAIIAELLAFIFFIVAILTGNIHLMALAGFFAWMHLRFKQEKLEYMLNQLNG